VAHTDHTGACNGCLMINLGSSGLFGALSKISGIPMNMCPDVRYARLILTASFKLMAYLPQ